MRILFYLLLALIISCNDNAQSNTDNSAPFSENIHMDDDFYFEKLEREKNVRRLLRRLSAS